MPLETNTRAIALCGSQRGSSATRGTIVNRPDTLLFPHALQSHLERVPGWCPGALVVKDSQILVRRLENHDAGISSEETGDDTHDVLGA
jgi:hypothetical protein